MTSRRRTTYVKRVSGLSGSWGWLKATGAILVVMIPLTGVAVNYVKTNIENSILRSQTEMRRAMFESMPSKVEFNARREEINEKLSSLKESVERSSGQMQLELASLRQALREHGEAIAQLKSAQEIERSLHRR